MFLNNLRISHKINLVLAILGVVTLIGAAYSGLSMKSIDIAYSALIDHDETAAFIVARGERHLQAFLGNGFNLAFEITGEGNARLLKIVESSQKGYLDGMETAEKLAPAYVSRIEQIKADAQTAFDRCDTPIRQAASTVNAETSVKAGQTLKAQCEPLIMPLIEKQKILSNDIASEVNKRSDNLTSQTHRTIVISFGVVIVGFVLALFFALWVSGTTTSDEAANTNALVQKLAAAADRIGEIVQLINDIASQTNLLALNATIEAARAGEVKNLASQTARATEEISQQVASVQEETRNTVTAIQGIASVIQQIKEISASISSAVEEQGAATGENAERLRREVLDFLASVRAA